ncbi:capsular exopolysaccharide synthesis family protein [Desulfobotulus alkaliphilus]|uniref:Capsular exopolysaccharide synthesis family protein n=1 Tax=Desulfobotulus alkaliphilus TaxID=622671 RepID=A0A562RGH5_9BACT|nr:polysaccharide biosynthesis tyrosine autokinase [Desulfobotulus alkaliphilus]TWI68199.1 capsular exopolysaccharide synthesis family protein [Desulfobotulus alkaliphilus]
MEVKEKEIHLKDYLRVVMKRKKMVAVFFFITLITVIIGSISSTPLYRASVKLKLESNDANPLAGNIRYYRYDPEFTQTQMEIIQSKAVAEKVVDYLDLVNSYNSFFPETKKEGFSLTAYFKEYLKDFISTVIRRHERDELAAAEEKGEDLQALYFAHDKSPGSLMAEMVRGGVAVSPVQMSRIINVSYTSQNPVFSALVVNSIAQAYIERILEMRMENVGYTLDWMKKTAQEEREKLESAEMRLQQFLRDRDIVTIEDRIAIIPQRLNQLSSDLTQAESERKRLEAVVQLIRQTEEGMLQSIPVIATNRAFQDIRALTAQKNQEFLDASQRYGERHPVMQRLTRELEALEERKVNEIRSIVQALTNEYQLALANEKNLTDQLRRTKSEASRLNEAFVQYKIFQREVETSQQLYQALVGRIKEQTITEQTRDVDVWVIERAKVPTAPFNQNMKKNILLGLVLGLFGGIGLAFFLEYLDNRISMAEDAEEKTGLPVFGAVGTLRGNDEEKLRVLLDHPSSLDSEAYKSIRASLSLATSKGLPASLMVTSHAPGEGKTLTCVNLAISIAMSGKNVLLVDADMRKPRLHKIFNLDNTKGFSGLLSGEEFKKGTIFMPQGAHFYVMPAGKKPVNPSELLSSNLMDELIVKFVKAFDIVIFDTPPAGLVSDAVVLAQKVENVLLVTRSEKTKYDDVKACIRKFAGLEAKVIGQIVNAIDLKRQGYGEGAYYDSEYYK